MRRLLLYFYALGNPAKATNCRSCFVAVFSGIVINNFLLSG